MATEHIHFVTGKLAEGMLRRTVEPLAAEGCFEFSIGVLPITVAALMSPAWIAGRVAPPAAATRLMVPGYCSGDLSPIQQRTGLPVERGPKDLRQLPRHFGRPQPPVDLSRYTIEILAEINHCPRMSPESILTVARSLAADGADVIDLGCEPGGNWAGVSEAVRTLRDAGLRVSIDSFNPAEVVAAIAAGAELVLSVNASNRDSVKDWPRGEEGIEAVAVPDDPHTLGGLDVTVQALSDAGVGVRIDPVVEPIGSGFAASLGRYIEVRRRYPEAAMLMGIGNLTELTEVDSAGVNALLMGFCEELGIGSVLTTQVIPWARSSVRECDLARRLMHYAVSAGVPPKHAGGGLVTLRDRQLQEPSPQELADLASAVRDNNYRLFAAAGEVHLVGAGLHLHDPDPFEVYSRLASSGPNGSLPKNLTASHAFYLGFELHKALTAITLGKQYEQDESLDWGYLTHPERHRRIHSDLPGPEESL